jgi:hypothetical protein
MVAAVVDKVSGSSLSQYVDMLKLLSYRWCVKTIFWHIFL